MADQLCTPEQLASALQQDLDAATANLWVNAGTAVVQEAAGTPPQRILEVEDDEVTLIGTTDSWLYLPQRPVTAVISVHLDGSEISEGTETGTYRRFGSKLWRDVGWAECAYTPSTVVVVNTHGYAAGHQGLELARSAVLGLAKQAYANVAGVKSEKVDDYAVVYEAISACLEASPSLKAALRRQYGRGAGLVKIS
jgi:hypothetical protein